MDMSVQACQRVAPESRDGFQGVTTRYQSVAHDG
jgi:hypothetical protein